MIKVSNNFKLLTKKIKQQDLKLNIVDGELTVKEIHFMTVKQFNLTPVWMLRARKKVIAKELKYSFEGKLFKTIMKQIEITVKNAGELKDKNVNFQYGIYVNNNFEYVDLGDFYIKDIEDNKGKSEMIVTGYDKMINFMKTFKQSDLQLTYPCTMLTLIQKMCEVCGVKLYSTNFFNADLQVDEDYFTAQELTYRDVLEKVAESTETTIFIKDNKLYLHKLANNPVEKLDASYLTGLTIKEKFGPVNALVLGRGDVEDNVESKDDTSIAKNGRCEIRFDENEFVQYKREQVIDAMFEQIRGLEYYAFEGSDVGIMWLEPCDLIEVEDTEKSIYKTIYLSANITINTGISSDIESDIPEETNTEYKVTTKEEKKTLKVERLAKKNEGLIQDVIEQQTETENKLTKVEQDIDGITQTVSSVETKIETVEDKAEQAQTSANTANTNAQNAQHAANNAQNTANSAVSQIETTTEKLAEVEQSVDGFTQTVSSIETQIETIDSKADSAQDSADEAISKAETTTKKVSQIEQTVEGITQTVDDVQTNIDENYSTTEQMNSAIEQKAGSITSSVTKTIDNILVGGTNLIPNSAPFDTSDYYISDTSSIELTLQNEETAPYRKCLRIRTLKQLTSTSGIYIYMTKDTLEEGKEYCFSIWLKATANTIVTTGYNAGGSTSFNVTTSWQKFTHKFTATATSSSKVGFPIYLPVNTIEGRQVFVHSIKLEEGNKVTAWSPAPKDDVKGFEFGTKIIQDWESVQIAWNQISEYIQFINAMLEIKDGDKNLLMTLNKNGQYFYNNGDLFGSIGTANYAKDHSQKGLSFGMNTNGRFMAWGKQETEGGNYVSKMFYCSENSFGRSREGIYFSVPIFFSEEIRMERGDFVDGEDYWPAIFISDNIVERFIKLSRIECDFECSNGMFVNGYRVQTNTSDGRLKHNIKNTEINAIDRIKKLKHRQFIWNKDNKQEQIGYIAQELEQIDENYVTKNPQYDEDGNVIDNLYQVNLLPILATATKAIQELEDKLEEKEKIINKQQELLQKLAEKVGLEDEYNTLFNSSTPKMAKAMKIENDEIDYGTEIKRSTNFKKATPNRLIITKDGTVRKENDDESNNKFKIV